MESIVKEKLTTSEIKSILNKQREFFNTGQTKSVSFRIEQLKKLRDSIVRHESEIINALSIDLNKPEYESLGEAFYIILEDIKHTIKNLRKWSKDKKVKTPMLLFKSKSCIRYEPYGSSLIIGSWNVPFTVTFLPLVGIIAAGNTAVIKPSEIAVKSSGLISKIIKDAFNEEYISVVEGGVEVTTSILKERFDLMVYTGSTKVGKIVAEAAAKNLTPTVLELGGKNPCIIDKDVNIDVAVKRIVWAKFINAGQICTSPDYLLVHEDVKEEFIKCLKNRINECYGENQKRAQIIAE